MRATRATQLMVVLAGLSTAAWFVSCGGSSTPATWRVSGTVAGDRGARKTESDWAAYLLSTLNGDNRRFNRINLVDVFTGIGGPEKDAFCNWDAYNTGICRPLDGAHPVAAECFDLRPDEAIYGLGEKFIKLNKVGQTLDLNMVDALGDNWGRTALGAAPRRPAGGP